MPNRCRACLSLGDNMRFLAEDEPDGEQLIAKYTWINNFEWIKNDHASSYLCSHCETALEISYDFQRKCCKSYEILMEQITSEALLLESQDYSQSECDNDGGIIVKYESEADEKHQLAQDVEESPGDDQNEQNISYKCTVCLLIFSTISALSYHMCPKHKDVTRNWCHLCNCVVGDLANHRGSTHKVSDDNQSTKSTTHQSHSSFNPNFNSPPKHSHDCSDTGQLKNECEKITGVEDDAGDQVVNEEQNNCEKVSPNQYCAKCDRRVRSLPKHMRKVHSNIEEDKPANFTCCICAREMKSSASLRAHLKVHQGDTPHKCSYCGKPHKNKGQLVEHERTHTGEKPYICSVCGKGFAQAGALGTHMKLHTGRPFVCKICDKRFCRPSELKLHLRRHSGEKPFLCTDCGKTFVQKSHLVGHMQTHSDVRPFVCVYCDKAFKQKSLLTFHVKSHSGHKPYKCRLCEYACFKAYRLQQHIMKLHDSGVKKEKEYVCPVCQKGFCSQAMLNGHVTSNHNVIL